MKKKKFETINMSIFKKQVLASLAFVIIPVSIIGITSLIQFSNTIQEQTISNMQNKVNDKLDLLESIVEGQKSEAYAIAHDTISINCLKELKNGLPQIPQVEKQQIRTYLKSFNKDKKYENLFFTDSKGIIVADSSDGNSEGVDVSEREYFIKPRDTKVSVVSDVIISVTNGETVMVVSVPLFDEEDEFIGIMGISVYFNPLMDSLVSRAEAEKYNYIIFNKNGDIVAHEDSELVFKMNFSEGNSSQKKLYQTMQSNVTSTGFYYMDNTEKTMAYTTYNANSWVIACAISVKDYMNPIMRLVYQIIIIIIVCLLVTFVFVLLFSRSISNPLKELSEIAQSIAEGDLTQKVIAYKSKDEIGKLTSAFENMIDKLNTVIKEVRSMSVRTLESSESMQNSSEEANQATAQIAESVNELAKGASELARYAEMGNNKILDLICGLNDITNEMMKSQELAESAQKSVKEGKNSVTFQADKMQENKDVMHRVTESIQIMAQKSNEMEDILSVIMSISQQTNLLSLNASIEAARAGEHGRGFAVVAQEIGQLAEQSGASVHRINEMISEVQESVNNAVIDMKDANDTIIGQENALKNVVEAFARIEVGAENINSNVNKVADLTTEMDLKVKEAGQIMGDIASISEESAAGTQQVAASTQEQSATIEQIATDSGDLSHMAKELQKNVEVFTIKDNQFLM